MHYDPKECADILSAALDAIEDDVRIWVRLPESSVPTVCAWIAHTYLIDEDGFPATVTPRLGFTSRKRGGGKSTALSVVQRLSRNGEKFLIPSKAGYMNAIELHHSTICLEEMDKTFPKPSSRMDIQAALNAGYEPDGGTIAHGNRKVPTHAFVAFAGIGPVLETNEGLEPLWHRTIKVEMIQVDEEFPEYDSEDDGPGIAYLKRVIGSAMEYASLVYGNGLRSLRPERISGLDGRRMQIWRALRRIGMAAGPEWQARIDQSCADMESGRSGEPPVRSRAARIMADVRAVTFGESVVGTAELVSRLRALQGAPWAFLWPVDRTAHDTVSPGVARELAELLEPHGLVPDFVRVPLPGGGGRTVKERGYRLTDHRDCGVCTDESGSARIAPAPARMPENGTDVSEGGTDGEDLLLSSLAVSMAVRPVVSRAPAPVPLFAPPAV